MNAVNLFKNNSNSTRRPLVPRKLGGKLLCPASDNPKGCRNLVRNPDRKRAHDRCSSGAFQALVTLAAYVGDFQPVSQKKLLALVAHGQTAEAEHEPARCRHAQNQTPVRPALTIALAFGTGDRRNSPPSRGSGIHLSQTRQGRTDRQPKAASLGRFQTQESSTLSESRKDFRRDDESPIGGMETRRIGRLDQDHAMVRLFGLFGLSGWTDCSGQVALDDGRQFRPMRERILRDVGVAKRRQMCLQGSGNASGQSGLFLRKISKSRCSFTLFVDVG